MMEEMRAVEQELLTISALGYGKRRSAFAYRTTGRGGKGVAAALINRNPGDLAACFQIGRAPVCTPVTNAHLVCRLLLEKQLTPYHIIRLVVRHIPHSSK